MILQSSSGRSISRSAASCKTSELAMSRTIYSDYFAHLPFSVHHCCENLGLLTNDGSMNIKYASTAFDFHVTVFTRDPQPAFVNQNVSTLCQTCGTCDEITLEISSSFVGAILMRLIKLQKIWCFAVRC